MPNPLINRRIILKRTLTNSVVYDTDAQAFFDAVAVPDVDKPYINNVVLQLKATLSLNGTTSNWTECDRITLGAINSAVALRNLKSNNYHGIISGTGGVFSDGSGYTGNVAGSFYIDTNYNPGDGGTYKWTQNSAKCFFLNLSTAQVTGYSIGVTNLASSNGTILVAGKTSAYTVGLETNSTSFGGTFLISAIAYNRAWIGMTRNSASGATAQMRYINGNPVLASTVASATVPNFKFTEFARNRGNTIQDFADNSKGVTVYGSKDIDEFTVQKIFEEYFLKPRNKADWMPNRLQTFGDSMTAIGTNGNNGRWTRTALQALGATWQGHNGGLGGATISGNLEVLAVSNLDPFQKTYLTRDIVAFWGGTNDLANSSAVTGTTVQSRLATWVANRKTAGYSRFIINGMVDRDATFSGGQTQAGFDIGRALFNSLMLLDFNVATSVSNVWTSNIASWAGCCFVDVFADSKFANAADITYFLADGIHPNATLDDVLANTYIVPLINANVV